MNNECQDIRKYINQTQNTPEVSGETTTSGISKDTLRYLAHLSRIKLGEPELEKLAAQLKDIVNFIDKLKTIDVEKIKPTSHILSLKNIFRKDTSVSSLSVNTTLKNAPQSEGHFFLTPKVIE
jgi:aspartyl-tRNA(Asn)/glutamyl-tRNA(Gln) amidotransferase subunit C